METREAHYLLLPVWSFNGATVFRPWKPLTLVLHLGHEVCFNGATVFRPWKLCDFLSGAYSVQKASMGPRSFDHGNSARASKSDSAFFSFNGATVFRPWKPPFIGHGRLHSLQSFNGATVFRPWKQSYIPLRRRISSAWNSIEMFCNRKQ